MKWTPGPIVHFQAVIKIEALLKYSRVQINKLALSNKLAKDKKVLVHK